MSKNELLQMFLQEKIHVFGINLGFKYNVKRNTSTKTSYPQDEVFFWNRLYIYWEESERAAWRSELEWWRLSALIKLSLKGQTEFATPWAHDRARKIFLFFIRFLPPLTWSVRSMARKCSHSWNMIPERGHEAWASFGDWAGVQRPQHNGQDLRGQRGGGPGGHLQHRRDP